MQRPTSVVFFDIDGTLIRRSGPRHRAALEYATRRALGVSASTDGIPVHGMLETGILTLMLRKEGVPLARIRELMPELIQVSERRYLRDGPESLEKRVCPGVRGLLSRLQRRNVPMLLVTGNFPGIGWRKMEKAGLSSYFRDGAFAGMSPTRAGLARIALRKANEAGWLRSPRSAVLISESPNDIDAARKNGIRSIAVRSGISTHEELAAHQPDLLVHRLSELRLATLLGGE
ncbi:MAG: HAD family hydrolase [Bryobacterales bacterium]|nr:HAD family hydrolase [Bryobacterales bacterium]